MGPRNACNQCEEAFISYFNHWVFVAFVYTCCVCIFSWQNLWNIHRQFYDDLRRSKEMRHIASCFVNVKSKFVIYGKFCANLQEAQATLNKICSTQSELSQFICQCNVSSSSCVLIDSFPQWSTVWLIGWRRGSVVRTLVFGWRTLPDLCLIYGRHVTTLWVKCFDMGQPSRPAQPSLLLGSVNE